MSKVKGTPEGLAGFSQVREAKGYKGDTTKKSFSQGLILDAVAGRKFIEELQVEADRLYARELEARKSKGLNTRVSPPFIRYKELEGGSIQLTFKRVEVAGPPAVLTKEGTAFTGSITPELKIVIGYELRPYVFNDAFGVSKQLVAVVVVGSSDAVDESSVFEALGFGATASEVKGSKPLF